jgi:hypothetical protein
VRACPTAALNKGDDRKAISTGALFCQPNLGWRIQVEDVLLEIWTSPRKLAVEFAFPTRTLHVETTPAAARSGAVGADIAHFEPAEARRG